MGQAATTTMGLRASDVTGQKVVRAPAVPAGFTVTQLVDRLIAKMGLSRNDTAGQPLRYQARLDREGRHLHGSETVGEALREGDSITLTPNIDAG
jgi:hypothetical protein